MLSIYIIYFMSPSFSYLHDADFLSFSFTEIQYVPLCGGSKWYTHAVLLILLSANKLYLLKNNIITFSIYLLI